MKRIIITLAIILAVSGLAVGSLFFYKSKADHVYNLKHSNLSFCEDSEIKLIKEGFKILTPEIECLNEKVATLTKSGLLITGTPGEAIISIKGFMFEYLFEVKVSEHEGNIENCDLPYECRKCGEKVSVKEGHSLTELSCEEDSYCLTCGFVSQYHEGHKYINATCFEPETCMACDKKNGQPLEHIWVGGSCEEVQHCSLCMTNGDKPLGHSIVSATCTEDSYCSRCKAPGPEKAKGHNMLEATCTEASKCADCDYTEGKELGHKTGKVECLKEVYCERCEELVYDAAPHEYVKATCTKAKYCKRCKKTEGEPLGHTVVEATCSKGSYCSKCNTVLSSAQPHLFVPVDGGEICAYCGKPKSAAGYYYETPASIADYANQVVTIVNQERAAAGLAPLTMDPTLNQIASLRAYEISGYFSHTRPNGSSCFTAFAEAGYKYSCAGENIAAGYTTPSHVMDGWMNSSGHRANILAGNFGRIGVAVYSDNGYLNWVQVFSN